MDEAGFNTRRMVLAAMALSPLGAARQDAATTPSEGNYPVSIRNWGVMGVNGADDTARIQRALDEAPIGCDLVFPAGSYRITRQLDVRRKLNIVGQGAMFFGNFDGDREGDMFSINITDDANHDNRNQRIEGIRASFISGGRNLIHVRNQPPNVGNLGMLIQNNVLATLPDSDGHCIRLEGPGTHFNTIKDCQIENGIFLNCADGTIITGCLVFGFKTGVTLDMIEGAFHTRIMANGIVSRDGALHIRNGSQIFFEHNHVEQFQGYGRNRSAYSSSVCVDPVSYGSRFVHIEKNNFGGGSNVDTSIYVAKECEDLFIDHNVFNIVASGYDIRLADPSVRWTRLGPNNITRGTAPQRSAADPSASLSILDRGTGSYGVRKGIADLGVPQGGWAGAETFRFWKTLDEAVRFQGAMRSGAAGAGALVGQLPAGFRPVGNTAILCPSDKGVATLSVAQDGRIRIFSAAADAELYFDGVTFSCRGRAAYSPGL